MPDDPARRETETDGARRRRAGSQRGGEVTRKGFAEIITRKRYAVLVEIHPTTLRRWEAAGVVHPRKQPVLGIPTHVFTEQDVAFGRQLAALVRERPGELSLRDAARSVRASMR